MLKDFDRNVVLDINYETEKLTSMNAVPKVKFRSDEQTLMKQTNYKRNTIGGLMLIIK